MTAEGRTTTADIPLQNTLPDVSMPWTEVNECALTARLNYVDPTVSTGRSTISWKLSLSVLFLQVSLEQLFWWSAVVTWNVTEGKRGGRSWRTQVRCCETHLSRKILVIWASLPLPISERFKARHEQNIADVS